MSERPTVDEYFIKIAQDVKSRSEDLFFKCGCVFIHTESKHIISTGFNGLVPGATEELVDRTDREARRPYMLHAEKNAILHCTRHPMFIGHCSAYITTNPCFQCFQDMVAFGIKRIVYNGDNEGLSAFYDKDRLLIENLLKHRQDIELTIFKQ